MSTSETWEAYSLKEGILLNQTRTNPWDTKATRRRPAKRTHRLIQAVRSVPTGK